MKYTLKQAQILGTALKNVADHGFNKALVNSVRQHGYSDATLAVLKPFDLVMYHLYSSRQNLANSFQSTEIRGPKSYAKMGSLVQSRLKSNEILGPRLGEAIRMMTQPTNLGASLQELHALSDEVAYQGGDKSTGADWYATRAAISGAYTASELFMSKDASVNYSATMEFVKHRFAELEKMACYGESTSEWVSFNAMSAVNVLKSLTR